VWKSMLHVCPVSLHVMVAGPPNSNQGVVNSDLHKQVPEVHVRNLTNKPEQGVKKNPAHKTFEIMACTPLFISNL